MKQNGCYIYKIKRIISAAAVLALIPVLLLCGCNSERTAFNWVRSQIDKYYYYSLQSGCEYNGSVKDFVRQYLDEYSQFYTAEEYKTVSATSSGKMDGLGISFEYVPEGVHPSGESGIHLVKVIGNSPAYYSGLSAGEFVKSVSYNGEIRTFDSATSFTLCLDDIPEDASFTITTDRGTYQTSKTEYTASYCYMATNSAGWRITYDNGDMKIVEESVGKSCLPNGAAYLRLDKFYGNAAQEMASLIEIFNQKNCTSLILDLRQNGGGYVSAMSNISAIYTGQLQNQPSSMGIAEYKNGYKEYYRPSVSFASRQQLPAGVKVSVLADNATASASEALIGVLICNGVIDYSDVYISDFDESYLTYSNTLQKDCRTYGKGIMQTTYVHAIYRYAIKLTTAKIFWSDGVTSIHGTGLGQEMGCRTVAASWSVTYADEQLSSAVNQIYAPSGVCV